MTLVGYNKEVIKALQPLLILSDSEIKKNLEECEKFKHYITAITKSHEAVFINAKKSKPTEKYRKRSKNIKIGAKSLLPEIGFALVSVILLVAVSSLYFSELSKSTIKISTMINQQNSLTKIYSNLCKASNDISYSHKLDLILLGHI